MKIIKILLFPFAILYGIGVFFRNKCYDIGVLRSTTHQVPVISVGNLSTGGTGKSPHVEYLIRMLRDTYQVAVLSRGYGRKGSGYKLAGHNSTARDIGDEPEQFHTKYPDVVVAVGEDRSKAIKKLMEDEPDTQVVLLDDAFQHRGVNPGLNILLTRYDQLYIDDFILPTGNLREWAGGAARADLIVVTKCPPKMQSYEYRALTDRIKPKPYQDVFFTYLDYEQPYELFNADHKRFIAEDDHIILLCGIADIKHIQQYVEERAGSVDMMRFRDHQYFRDSDLNYIQSRFNKITDEKRYILTTEKDATRLRLKKDLIEELGLPIYVLPVKAEIQDVDKANFHDAVNEYLKSKI